MMTNFTFDDLILYNYNELPKEMHEPLELHLSFDENLRETHQSILQMKAILDTERKKPSDTSIRLIMDYDRKSRGELETI